MTSIFWHTQFNSFFRNSVRNMGLWFKF
uniref:Uncharacterized protein n=1 Tax=Rhizophora mucronata TaxID=61149 RepID=A0A2P2IJK1_RHIMU